MRRILALTAASVFMSIAAPALPDRISVAATNSLSEQLSSADSGLQPSARFWYGLAYDAPRREIVLFGGQTSCCPEDFFADTWTWNGVRWTEEHPAHSPPARSDMGMAYDHARGEVVLFGGEGDAAVLADTWAWDGNDWVEKDPATSPPPNVAFGMAYDGARREVVLFGGGLFPSVRGATWTWDGTTWTREQPSQSPDPRNTMEMVYDHARQEVMLFGGCCSEFPEEPHLDDTWTWDGNTWTEESPNAFSIPDARSLYGMAYDARRRVTVLFGGAGDQGAVFGDTWEWDGQTWTRVTTPTSPLNRRNMSLAYHHRGRHTLVFGGLDIVGQLREDTWLLFRGSWHQVP